METKPILPGTLDMDTLRGFLDISGDVQRHWIYELGFQERGQDQMYKLGRYECTGTVSSLRLHGITLVRTQ